MAFTLNTNTITQTGVDADLSGLAGIAGVTTLTEGSGGHLVTVYDIGNRRLRIEGVLNQNPDFEKIIIGEGISGQSVVITGTYNYGVETTFSGYTQRSTGLGLVITRSLNANFNDPVFDVSSTGIFNWNGGVINTAGTMYFRTGSTININEAVVNVRNDNGGQTIRSFTTNFNVNGLRKVGGGFILYQAPSEFSGFVPVHSDLSPQNPGRKDYALLFYGPPDGTSSEILVKDFSGFGNPNEIGYIDNAKGKLVNPENGSNTTFGGWLGTGEGRSDTYIEITKEIEINFSDASGLPIDAKTYIIDDDNGNRLNQNGEDNTADKVYIASSTSGKVEIELINGIVNVLNGVNDDLVDVRFNSNIANARFINYSKSISQTNIDLLGTGKSVTNWTLFDDFFISETNKTIAEAYTTQETPPRAYDALKAYLVNNFQGETETLVSTDLFKSFIDAGTYDITIDGGIGVPTLVGNNITIFTDNAPFVGDIYSNTTTVQNGATVRGLITDVNLDSIFIFNSITYWEIYPTVADRTNKTNLIASGMGSEVYHFKNTGLDYFFSVATDTGTEVNVNVLAADYTTGKNEVSLDNTSLILSLLEGQKQLPTNIWNEDVSTITDTNAAGTIIKKTLKAAKFAGASN